MAAQAGWNGHRAWTATMETLADVFWWNALKEDMDSFANSCIHYLSTTGEAKVPRTVGSALHVNWLSEIVNFPYCHFVYSKQGRRRIFPLKDDLSSYTWL